MTQHKNTPSSPLGRREFLATAGAAAAGLYLGGGSVAKAEPAPAAVKAETLALNGGKPAVTLTKEKLRRGVSPGHNMGRPKRMC